MELFGFIGTQSVLHTICAATISTQVVSLADALTNSIIVPVIDNNVDFDDDKIEHMNVSIGGVNLGFGKLLIVLIRIIVLLLLLYLVYHIIYD